MLQFILGVIVGSLVSFFVFAICSMAGTDSRTEFQCKKRIGEEDAGRK
jgi:hypothetical protein